MGVMQCERNGCKNVCCERHSDTYGNICWECFEELKKFPNISIGAFMNSERDDTLLLEDYHNYLNEEFRLI